MLKVGFSVSTVGLLFFALSLRPDHYALLVAAFCVLGLFMLPLRTSC